MAEFTTAFGQDGPEITKPSSAMFLTTCAVCAKALNNDEARECEKCGTRFCGETCENEHRAQAKICDDTAEDGGAELIHINQKGTKAWEHAVSSCAEEAAGKTCYICMEILDGDGDNCVRGCACRGDSAGFAHLSCLAQQALGIMQARIPGDLGANLYEFAYPLVGPAIDGWHMCQICKSPHTTDIATALGWTCFRLCIIMGRPEEDGIRCMALTLLSNSLQKEGTYQEALPMIEALLATVRRAWPDNTNELIQTSANLANVYGECDKIEEAAALYKDLYEQMCALHGPESVYPATMGSNYAQTLIRVERFADAQAIGREIVQWAHRNPDSPHSFHIAKALMDSLYKDPNASVDDLREAVEVFENIPATSSRVLGTGHPDTKNYEKALAKAKKALAEKNSA